MFDYFEVLIGFLATLVTAYAGYRKYLNQRQFTDYKNNLKNLFSSKKTEKLAAVATLGVYKDRAEYKQSTVDTLLNLIYTELDYDISNAVIGVLAQTKKEEDFEYIAVKLIEINRNFFTQSYPMSHRKTDIEQSYANITKDFLVKIKEGEKEDEELAQWKNITEKIWIVLRQINDYELKWHKLAAGDVLSMILRRADQAKISNEIKVEIFQNDFNFCQFNGFSLYKSPIRRSALSVCSITDVSFIDFGLIEDCTFARTNFTGGVLSGGKIKDTSFCGAQFEGVTFKDIVFENAFFIGASVRNCVFNNVKGLNGIEFYSAYISDDTQLDKSIKEKAGSYKSDDEAIAVIERMNMLELGKTEVISYIRSLRAPETKETEPEVKQ
jgi:uncharacterized protein YjbI with pentapeptide repeats